MKNLREEAGTNVEMKKTVEQEITEIKNGVYFMHDFVDKESGRIVYLKFPSSQDELMGRGVYQRELMRISRNEDIPTKKEIENFLKEKGEWDENITEKIEKLEKRNNEIDQEILKLSEITKIINFTELRENFDELTKDMDKRQAPYKNRKALKQALEERDKIQNERYKLMTEEYMRFSGCAESIAKYEQNRYLMAKSLVFINPETNELEPSYTVQQLRDMDVIEYTYLMSKWEAELGRYAKRR